MQWFCCNDLEYLLAMMMVMMESHCNNLQQEEGGGGGGTNTVTAGFVEYVEKYLPQPHAIIPNDKYNGSVAMRNLSLLPSLI